MCNGKEKNTPPAGECRGCAALRHGDCAPAGAHGDAPPIFFLRHQKENAPCTVEKKRCLGAKPAPQPPFCAKRGSSWPVRCRFASPYQVRYTLAKQRTASPHLWAWVQLSLFPGAGFPMGRGRSAALTLRYPDGAAFSAPPAAPGSAPGPPGQSPPPGTPGSAGPGPPAGRC